MAGLYSGIVFSSGSTSVDAPSSASVKAGPAVASSSSRSSNATTAVSAIDLDKQTAILDDAARYAAASAEQAATAAAEGARKAALTFQPVVRKRPAPGANRPKNVLAITTAHISAGPSAAALAAKAEPLGSASPAGVKADNAPAVTISAPPAMSVNNDKTGVNVLTGRTLIVAPSMTLDEEDVNGFKASAAGKKAANKNKKRKGRNKREEDPSLAWTAEYDPARPTDYVRCQSAAPLSRISLPLLTCAT